jgi:hypothetical protein
LSTEPSRSYLVIASAIVIAGVLISASLFVAIGQSTKTVTSTTTATSAQTATTVSLNDSYSYLSASGICSGPGGYGPCWSSGHAYIFDCAGSAATSEGCTQEVTSTLAPFPSYTINIRNPFTNQTVPSWANCLWTVAGTSPSQGYAYCAALNSTSFVIGEQAPPHL